MTAEFRNPDMAECPISIEPYARDPNLTPGREYVVHAITVYEGVVGFLVVDDLDIPGWPPAWLFKVTDRSLPQDWVCNAFPDWPALVIGPSFISESQEAYARMVELDAAQVALLRQRVQGK